MSANIERYFHCSLCVSEAPEGLPPREYQSIEAGMTSKGFQVWCKRHDCNIVTIELNGDNWTWDDAVELPR